MTDITKHHVDSHNLEFFFKKNNAIYGIISWKTESF